VASAIGGGRTVNVLPPQPAYLVDLNHPVTFTVLATDAEPVKPPLPE